MNLLKIITNYFHRFIQFEIRMTKAKMLAFLIIGLLIISYDMLQGYILRAKGLYTQAIITHKTISKSRGTRYSIHYKFSTASEDKTSCHSSQIVPKYRYNALKVGDIIEVVYLARFPAINDIRIPVQKNMLSKSMYN